MPARLKRLLILAAVPLLAACEYEGAAYLIEGKDHSISLVREQRWFWSSEVEQAVVVSRMPCRTIVGGRPGLTKWRGESSFQREPSNSCP